MASARAILSAKGVCGAAKDAEVAEKVRTASMIARKYRGDIEICCKGGADVLGPAESEEAGDTRDAEEASDPGRGAGTDGVVDARI